MGCTRTPTWGGSVLSWLLVGIMTTTSIWPVGCAGDALHADFNYINLWTSQDGETHIKQCKMQNATREVYGLLPQYMKSDFGGSPIKIVFVEVPPRFTEGLHNLPAVQFVTTLSGNWYVKKTDGSEYTFGAGEVLFQDNVVTSPADKVPQHYSGVAGNVPCMNMLVFLNRPAQVDNPCPF